MNGRRQDELSELNIEYDFSDFAVVTMVKVPGLGSIGGDFDTEYRIGEAYAKAGKEMAQYVWKKVLK